MISYDYDDEGEDMDEDDLDADLDEAMNEIANLLHECVEYFKTKDDREAGRLQGKCEFALANNFEVDDEDDEDEGEEGEGESQDDEGEPRTDEGEGES